MARTWADSWGDSWADSWGANAVVVAPTPVARVTVQDVRTDRTIKKTLFGVNIKSQHFDQNQAVRRREIGYLTSAKIKYVRMGSVAGQYEWTNRGFDPLVNYELLSNGIKPRWVIFAGDYELARIRTSWRQAFLVALGYSAGSTDKYQWSAASQHMMRAAIASQDSEILGWMDNRVRWYEQNFPGANFEIVNNDVLFNHTDYNDWATLTTASVYTAYDNLGVDIQPSTFEAGWDAFRNRYANVGNSKITGWFFYNDRDSRGSRVQHVTTEDLTFCSEFSDISTNNRILLLENQAKRIKKMGATEAYLYEACPSGYSYLWGTEGATESLWQSGGASDNYSVMSTVPRILNVLGGMSGR